MKKYGVIFCCNCSGQLCNRLVMFTNALATALDCNRKLIFLAGKDIRSYAQPTSQMLRECGVTLLPFRRCKYLDFVNGCIERWRRPILEGAANSKRRVNRYRLRSPGIPIVVSDWYLRNWQGLVSHKDTIRAILKPHLRFSDRANQIVSSARESGCMVVGVHVRRGDYTTAFGGRYYYSNSQYREFLKSLVNEVGRKMKFLIVSNEHIDVDEFRESGKFEFECVSGTAEEDLALLSVCDVIVGPPSTFSWMASYIGNVPRVVMDAAVASEIRFVTAIDECMKRVNMGYAP